MTFVAIFFLSPLSDLGVFARVCVKERVRWMTLVATTFTCDYLVPQRKPKGVCCCPPVFLLYPEANTNQR